MITPLWLLVVAATGVVLMVSGLFVACERVPDMFSPTPMETMPRVGAYTAGTGSLIVLVAMALSYWT